MSYKLDVLTTGIWDNFVNWLEEQPEYRLRESDGKWDNDLKPFNAINLLRTDFLEFETEEDVIIFKLRFS